MRGLWRKHFSALFSLVLIVHEFNLLIATERLYKSQNTFDTTGLESKFLDENKNVQSRWSDQHDSKETSDLVEYDASTSKRAAAGLTLGIVQFLTGSFLLTGVLVGTLGRLCGSQHKNFKKNIEKSKELRDKANTLKQQINLEWGEVMSLQRYFERLNSNMEIMKEQIETIRTLEEDIITLIDPDIMKKIENKGERLKKAILEVNQTNIADVRKLEDEFFDGESGTKTILALKAVIFMGALAAGWAIRESAKQAGRNAASNWLGRNNKIAVLSTRRNALGNIKPYFKSKNQISNFMKRFPGFSNVRARLSTPKMQKAFGIIKTGIKVVAVGAALALASAFEIYRLWRNVRDCKRLEKESFEMLGQLKITVKKLDIVKEEKDRFHGYVLSNYSSIYEKVNSESFINFVENEMEVAKASKDKGKTLSKAVENMKMFIDSINSTNLTSSSELKYNLTKVDMLTTGLVVAFSHLATSFQCYRNRIALFAIAASSCGTGKGTKMSLYKSALKDSSSISSECPVEAKESISYSAFVKGVDGLLVARKKETICVRNNFNLKIIACNKRSKGTKDVDIANSMMSVTLDDVKHFLSNCPGKAVDGTTKGEICYRKALGNNLGVVKNIIKGFKESQIAEVYNECALSELQSKFICDQKSNDVTIEVLQQALKSYPPSLIANVYNACVRAISKGDTGFICAVVKIRNVQDVNNPIYGKYVSKYGKAKVEALIKDGCKS